MSSAKGELSLVVVKAGQDSGAITPVVFPIMGVVTIVTAFMAPYMIKFGSKIRIISPSLSPSTSAIPLSPQSGSTKNPGFGRRFIKGIRCKAQIIKNRYFAKS
jgi:hypothetical protein